MRQMDERKITTTDIKKVLIMIKCDYCEKEIASAKSYLNPIHYTYANQLLDNENIIGYFEVEAEDDNILGRSEGKHFQLCSRECLFEHHKIHSSDIYTIKPAIVECID